MYVWCSLILILSVWAIKIFSKRADKIDSTLNAIKVRFDIRNRIEIKKKYSTERNYDVIDCEIILTEESRIYHGYFKFIMTKDEAITISGKPLNVPMNIVGSHTEVQKIENADIIFLLFFERHLIHLQEKIRVYRKSLYKWNIGTLSYQPRVLPHNEMPN